MKTRGIVGLLLAFALIAAGCADRSGSDDTEASGGEESSTDDSTGGGGSSETFGDMDSPCGERDPETVVAASTDPAETQGLADGTIQLGTVADPGFEGRPGLNQEIFDAGNAFAEWCNGQGGINGREIQLTEYDAAISQYQQRLSEACGAEFAMVGGGAVSDNLWETTGAACNLVDVAGFAVTPEKAGIASPTAVEDSRTLQPIPNPSNQFPIGALRYLIDEDPSIGEQTSILYGDLQTLITQKDRQAEGMEQAGYDNISETSYNILGEANWSPLASTVRDDDTSTLIWIGEGENLANLQLALADLGYDPPVTMTDANLYDPNYLDAAGEAAEGTYSRIAIWPFEEASENEATQQYIDLIEAADGKVAALGAQSFSAWLLFAQLADECDVEGNLTRSCILEKGAEVDDWNGGGLHAPANVGENSGPECFIMLQVEGGEFVRSEPAEADGGDEGYNCDPDNVADLEGDFSSSG